MTRSLDLGPNISAFLDMIAWSEIGPALLGETDDGYNVLVGSTPDRPLTFCSYRTFPRHYHAATCSTAAGRYQFLRRYWGYYRRQLKLRDFSPQSQDRWAVQLIRECIAEEAIESGDIIRGIYLCGSRWASLPGNSYGQHKTQIGSLLAAYYQARRRA